MPTLSYCKSTNNCSLNLLLLKVVYLYQAYDSTENQVPLIYGMTYMTNQNRKIRYKWQKFANIFQRSIKWADNKWKCYLTKSLIRKNYIMHTVLYSIIQLNCGDFLSLFLVTSERGSALQPLRFCNWYYIYIVLYIYRDGQNGHFATRFLNKPNRDGDYLDLTFWR